MNISVEIKGDKNIVKKLQKMPEAGKQTILDALAAIAIETHSQAVRSVQTIKGSRTETRYNPKRDVTVSDGGQPWNSDLGQAVASLQWEVDADEMTAQVGSNLKYVGYLEVGTRKMSPRPVLMPAFQIARGILRSVLKFRADLVKK